MQTQETTDGADRAIPLVAMVTGDELAMIQAGAAMAGVSTGEWMRAAALDATRAPVGGADRNCPSSMRPSSTWIWHAAPRSPSGSPAQAGIDRFSAATLCCWFGFPRTSGDRPVYQWRPERSRRFPRTLRV